jgi:hypothetical protein
MVLRRSNMPKRMSALGQKQTSAHVRVMSALPPKADIGTQSWNVRFVPKRTLCSAAVEPAPGALAVTGNVDYGVDDDTGRDGDQVRYEAEVDA